MSERGEAVGRLGAAIASGCYGEAEKLVDEYRRQVEEELRQLSFSGPAALAVCGGAKDVFEQARRAVRAERAYAQARLERLGATRRYQRPVRPRARLVAEG